MSNFSSPETSNNYDEYPQVAQEDLERAKFRIGLKPRRLQQNIHALIRYGERSGYVAKCTEIAVVSSPSSDALRLAPNTSYENNWWELKNIRWVLYNLTIKI